MGSTESSSESELSGSDVAGENGSGRYADAGTVLANRPSGDLLEV